MQSDLKPIETKYNGNFFRSRTEARWAVFFSTLNLKYEYEQEGFNLDGIRYLPDFWLPELHIWFEIKGSDPSQTELAKAAALTRKSGHPTLIAVGQPSDDDQIVLTTIQLVRRRMIAGDNPDINIDQFRTYFSDCFGYRIIKFRAAYQDGKFGVANSYLNLFLELAKSKPLDLRPAIDAARYARFEHGALT